MREPIRDKGRLEHFPPLRAQIVQYISELENQ